MKKLLLLVSHLGMGAAGFALGIYMLPILTAPAAPSLTDMQSATSEIRFSGEFQRDLPGSDFFHWGEGNLTVSDTAIALDGKLAPGPDYKLYLSPVFVDDEASFNANKAKMVRVGDVRTFDNFLVNLPEEIKPADYNTAVVWCESFGEFISAAKYR
ncbi:MAG: DM13 domain-containing protein [bacterium]